MTYTDAVGYLDALGIDAMKGLAPSLQRIDAVCEIMGRPERSLPAIHVTGTNGKSSTTRIAASLLDAAGLTVGAFTSPHLGSIRERISVGGNPLGEEDFAQTFETVFPYVQMAEGKLGENLTYFEVLTAMFFLWAVENVDVAVVEVGLGGRWDATNVLDAPVAAITNVALDHSELLGDSPQKIAAEKVGIVKPEATLVTGERKPDVLAVLKREVEAQRAHLSAYGTDFDLLANDVAIGGRHLSIRTSAREYREVYLALHGSHQGVNAAVALEAATRFLAKPLGEDVVAEGFARVEIPGRLETIRLEDRSVLLDAAHNPDGMAALVGAVAGAFAFERLIVIFGALDDKDHVGMLSELRRLPVELILTQPANRRAVPVAVLAQAADALSLAHTASLDVASAVTAGIEASDAGALVVVTGSHYVVGEARTFLLAHP